MALRALQMTCNCVAISRIDEINAAYLRAEIEASQAQLRLAYALLDNYRDLLKKLGHL